MTLTFDCPLIRQIEGRSIGIREDKFDAGRQSPRPSSPTQRYYIVLCHSSRCGLAERFLKHFDPVMCTGSSASPVLNLSKGCDGVNNNASVSNEDKEMRHHHQHAQQEHQDGHRQEEEEARRAGDEESNSSGCEEMPSPRPHHHHALVHHPSLRRHDGVDDDHSDVNDDDDGDEEKHGKASLAPGQFHSPHE